MVVVGGQFDAVESVDLGLLPLVEVDLGFILVLRGEKEFELGVVQGAGEFSFIGLERKDNLMSF